ncbi:accessory gland-specific peptide 57Db [Drosophila subpulchrella]|nr:accessory gland-specific peptide 57Db [Drosophila subpulchrella]
MKYFTALISLFIAVSLALAQESDANENKNVIHIN